MSIKKNKNQLIISILVGVAIFAVTYQFIVRQHDENVQQRAQIEQLKKGIGVNSESVDENTTVYVIAKRDIAKNKVIEEDDIEMKDIEMKLNNAFIERKSVIGSTALKEIKQGRPVTKTAVRIPGSSNSDEPKDGFRAVSATVAANRIPPFVEDGTYIDIYTANNTIQANNVRIIKILDSSTKSSKLILFEIKEEDVGPFVFAMTKDKLIPVQKNRNEKDEYAFAYDPFKYSSYTMSSEDMGSLDGEGLEPVSDTGGGGGIIHANYPTSGGGQKRSETVELIQGSEKKTLDF